VAESNRRLYSPEQTEFRLFSDVIPTLERLKADGYRICIVSNWDYGLHRVVDRLGIASYFDHILASLVEGVEKPNPELFQIALQRANVLADEVIHIGDNPIDDIEGAHAAGISALLLVRTGASDPNRTISSLSQLPHALDRAVAPPKP
jgi:putative hydrolase of the HAD superfamily